MSPESPAPREPGIQMTGTLVEIGFVLAVNKTVHFCFSFLFVLSSLLRKLLKF